MSIASIVPIHLVVVVIVIAVAVFKPIAVWTVLSSLTSSIGVTMSTDMLRMLASYVVTVVVTVERQVFLIVLIVKVKVA